MNAEEVKQVFKEADKDGSGSVSKQELKELVVGLGKSFGWDDEKISDLQTASTPVNRRLSMWVDAITLTARGSTLDVRIWRL